MFNTLAISLAKASEKVAPLIVKAVPALSKSLPVAANLGRGVATNASFFVAVDCMAGATITALRQKRLQTSERCYAKGNRSSSAKTAAKFAAGTVVYNTGAMVFIVGLAPAAAGACAFGAGALLVGLPAYAVARLVTKDGATTSQAKAHKVFDFVMKPFKAVVWLATRALWPGLKLMSLGRKGRAEVFTYSGSALLTLCYEGGPVWLRAALNQQLVNLHGPVAETLVEQAEQDEDVEEVIGSLQDLLSRFPQPMSVEIEVDRSVVNENPTEFGRTVAYTYWAEHPEVRDDFKRALDMEMQRNNVSRTAQKRVWAGFNDAVLHA